MINSRVLMSDVNNFSIGQPINPYYHATTLDLAVATEEHKTIYNLFIQAGINVTKVESPAGCQDGVYTANWALVRGDKAILARLPDARKAEEEYAAAILAGIGKTVIKVPEGLKFSGQGDALACGNYLFCGKGYRSDEAAQAFAAEALGYDRIQLQTLPQLDTFGNPVINPVSGWADSFFYDIDLALAVIKHPSDNQPGLIAYCPDAFTNDSQILLDSISDIDKIIVSIDEAEQAFATNLVSTGETVIMSSRAPQLAADLRAHGIKVLMPETDIVELAKGGGFIRCISLAID
jgi:N-dimethylarginine dimethylaminohydrolase